MSFGDRFCMSRKGEAGGGGWVLLKGSDNMACDHGEETDYTGHC